MIPFCRTVGEAEKVLATMAKNDLKQGDKGLKVYAMCEIPSNVILAEQFLTILDGFSIGSNDLTQLVLGIDRDSELVADLYDERDPAVKAMLSQVRRGLVQTWTGPMRLVETRSDWLFRGLMLSVL